MQWKVKDPTSGDIIRTKVRFYYHFGIFVSPDEIIQFGLPDDPGRCAEEIKVLASDIQTFLHGGELEVGVPERAERKKMRRPEQVVAIARQRLGEGGYNLLHNNCEHFVNDCFFGQPSSSVMQNAREKFRQKLNK